MNKYPLQMLKSVTTKLDDDTIAILTFCYHTELSGEEDPITRKKKIDRSKSKYLYLGRVVKTDDLKAEISEMMQDSKAMDDWHWPKVDGVIYCGHDSYNKAGAKWLGQRIKKAIPFPDFVKTLNGYKKAHEKKFPDGINSNAVYRSTNYVLDDGTPLPDIKDKNALLKIVGHTFTGDRPLKTVTNK